MQTWKPHLCSKVVQNTKNQEIDGLLKIVLEPSSSNFYKSIQIPKPFTSVTIQIAKAAEKTGHNFCAERSSEPFSTTKAALFKKKKPGDNSIKRSVFVGGKPPGEGRDVKRDKLIIQNNFLV